MKSRLSPARVMLHARPLLVGILGLSSLNCRGKSGGPQAPPPREVGVVTLHAEPVALTSELAGRTVAYEESEVRPQITGIVQKRLFTEGSSVHAGQVLYEIAPQTYTAAAEQAAAALASAEATRLAANARAERFKSLVGIDAVSQQEAADAIAAAGQAEAAVQQGKAALSAARINVGFTRITAPISGHIGRSFVTTGALVTAGQAQPLTTIQRLDPIFVDVQQSSARLLELRRALSTGGVTPSSARVTLTLEDGTRYPLAGTLEFAEVSVDPSTGSVTLRARFPNPKGVLLPGMYVRADVGAGQAPQAILAPQQGVMRDPTGKATAFVVGKDSAVQSRSITVSRTIGDKWLVTDGLKDGDQIIVEGTSLVRPGQKVHPVPSKPATDTARAAGDSVVPQQR